MIQWREETIISANIEKVWNLFREENMPRIMPKVIENKPVHITEEVIGSKYQQKYQEGKRVETYIVETLGYEDTETRKFKRLEFVLAKAFEVNLSFTLEKLAETQTRFIYEGHNKGRNFVGRAMLKLGGDKNNHKVVQDFMELVEKEASK
ncbi:SRPBCC family protein [Rossellomorea vietnamensis]|uniref:SRPBCC family protein n=1 Tax=Rossellomorea vietnamensis TaxID=218284 RepID=A0A5D4MB05_9BACI|nr:SRPBCC family protein [Rossellomorea vietnamensis]TYR98668.1 SRPBCC family protein [Rossellomorea vietnamensis]